MNTTTSVDTMLDLGRRRFIVATAVAGGGLALGLPTVFGVSAARAAEETAAEVDLWVAIRPDDTCVIRIARAEMGQGSRTGLAQLVAEELECDWRKVTTEMVTAQRNYARKRAWGSMVAAGSRSIRDSHEYVRRGGAAARLMLLQAAANEWQVPVADLTVADGVIRHPSSGRSTSYGKVAAAAARLTPPDPKSIKLKSPQDWKLVKKPLKRLDTADKVNGKLTYSIDLKLPGMLNAAIKACPVFGGKVASYDETKVRGMRGVRGVVRVSDNAVAVVADTWWNAHRALAALPVVWDEGEHAKVSSASIAAHLKTGLTSDDAFADTDVGDTTKALAAAAKKVEAVYAVPFVAHACMEPMNCTVILSADKAEIWLPTQNPEASLAALSTSSGLPLDKCEVHYMDLGGGFGRRIGAQDVVRQGVAVAKAFPGVPVKLLWSREEDQTHDFYRPIAQARMQAGVDAQGNLVALNVRVSGQSINAFANPGAIKEGKDVRQLQGLWKQPGDAQFGYTVPNLRIEYAMRNTHLPVGPWRGVNCNQNGIFLECFMDEAAKLAGKDPLAFRRALMGRHPKHLGVLEATAARAGWGKPLARGVFRGIAQFMGYASYVAAVAEVSVSGKGEVRVHRMVLGTDCGHFVNAATVAAQVEGSVVYGFDSLLTGITVQNGRVVEQNFDRYGITRMWQMPKVETVIAPTYDFWGGVGEPTICVVVPAVLNAIFAATGKPVRTLPLKDSGLTLV